MLTNPFPGLRPFESDEDHLFFGRETEVDALLGRLRTARFVAVVGTSGSGKSSLVRSGLIPALHSGAMAGAGSSWRIATLRPGEDPIGHLATALHANDVLGTDDELADTRRVLLDATLRRGTQGLANAVRHAHLPPDHNVLVLVDQFEELFRFRRSRGAHARDESIAFVRLLLEATSLRTLPIYVVLTMRSDFLGDCMDFPGLPDAVNAGLFLVGRMSRSALRSALTGPVAVAGGAITPRLVNRVMNDLGDDQDQLPRVQHALMRTWEHWASRVAGDAAAASHTDDAAAASPMDADAVADPMDVADYEAIGGLADALSRHAEEAFAEASDAVGAPAVERAFKALTDTFTDPRGVRRPTPVGELAAVCGLADAEVIRLVEIFRRPGRSFLMPPAATPLTPASIVDLSHESLMRCWTRLIDWAAEEAESAELYMRLSRAAEWHAGGAGGLWRQPELGLASQWREREAPTEAWGDRLDGHFDRTMAFLDGSLEADRAEADRVERQRRTTLRRTQWTAAVLATLLVVAAVLAVIARRENARAATNLALAREAVDESLSSVDLDPSRLGADVPALEELRRDLLAKAQGFYTALAAQQPGSQAARHDLALAHLRLGHINRLLRQPEEAERQYREAVTRFSALAGAEPGDPAPRRELADAWHWLGETLRPLPGRAADARAAYDAALALQQAAFDAGATGTRDARALARTHYDRGILLSATADGLAGAEADFRAAVALLEPGAETDPASGQELARALNNLAGLLSFDPAKTRDALPLYERAIRIDERLVAADPGNREYQLELAKYYNNLAALQGDLGASAAARAASGRAVELLDGLARLAPSLAVERADARTLRGHVLVSTDPAAAMAEFGQALEIFASMQDDARVRGMDEFHLRFGDLLLDLAAFPEGRPGADGARRLLDQAVERYRAILTAVAANGTPADVQVVFARVSDLLPSLPATVRARLSAAFDDLQRRRETGR
ncbi:MAG: hypothetical protein R2752_17470 [Vicinamibacterales bacterium]